MKKMIPVILKGLGILIVIAIIGYGINTHIKSDDQKLDELRAQNIELLEELNQMKQERINEERRKMQKLMDDLAFENSKLNKEVVNLQKVVDKNSKKSF